MVLCFNAFQAESLQQELESCKEKLEELTLELELLRGEISEKGESTCVTTLIDKKTVLLFFLLFFFLFSYVFWLGCCFAIMYVFVSLSYFVQGYTFCRLLCKSCYD